MDWSEHEEAIAEWRAQTHAYVEAINRFVERGTRDGWDEAGPEPKDERTEELGARIAEVVRLANEAGEWRALRAKVPTAQAPFIPILEKSAVTIRSVCWIDEMWAANDLAKRFTGS